MVRYGTDRPDQRENEEWLDPVAGLVVRGCLYVCVCGCVCGYMHMNVYVLVGSSGRACSQGAPVCLCACVCMHMNVYVLVGSSGRACSQGAPMCLCACVCMHMNVYVLQRSNRCVRK